MDQPLVISYIRFSTAKQASGDSLRRQTQLARQWCIRRGWQLDETLTLHDLGLSGYHQDNIARGALSGFMEAVATGKIPQGSYLLIENLDRLTRADLPTAVTLLLSIANAGISCVTLQDDQEWNKERLTNPADFMLSIMILFRGHDESSVKSKRIRAVHDRARQNQDRSIFGRAPGWLKRSDNGTNWVAIPELVDIVHKVFELVASGFGGMSIARKANREQWPVPSLASQERGTTWHGTYPTKLARNRSVLGELELFILRDGKSQSTGNIVTDWYPQIIDKDLFFRANSAIDSKRALPPRRDSSHRNIFQGVIFCGHCGATLARKAKAGGKNSKLYAQYVCSDRHRGASECPNVNAKELEDGLVPLIFRYFSEHLGDDSRLSKLRDELASVKGQISSIEVLRLRYLEAIELATLAVHLIVSKLDECERDLSKLQTSQSEIESQMKASASIPLNDADAIVVLNALRAEDEESEQIRVEAHTKIIMSIDKIWVWPREMAALKLKGDDNIAILPLVDPSKKAEIIDSEEGEVAQIAISPRLIQALSGDFEVPKARRH